MVDAPRYLKACVVLGTIRIAMTKTDIKGVKDE